MLTPVDIADQLVQLIREAFPGDPVYRELLPEDFARPCTLLAQGSYKANANLGSHLIEVQPKFTLTCFAGQDISPSGDLREMEVRQMRLLNLFLPGYIKVTDEDGRQRAPKVAALELKAENGGGVVTVTFSYTLSRANFTETPQTPTMGALRFNEEVN